MISYFTMALSSIMVMLAHTIESSLLVPIALIPLKAGTAISIGYYYFSMMSYFDGQYLGLVMGVSNTVGRMSTILAPIIAM